MVSKSIKRSTAALLAVIIAVIMLMGMTVSATDYTTITIPVANAVVRDGDVVNMATVAGIPGNVLDTLKAAIGNAPEAKLRINFAGLPPDVLSWVDANLVQNTTSIWSVNHTGHDLIITSIDVMVPVNATTAITTTAATTPAVTTVTTTATTAVVETSPLVTEQVAYITGNPKTGDEAISLTGVILTVLSMLGTILTAFVLPLIRSKVTAAQWSNLIGWAETGVEAAEALARNGVIKDKLQYVSDYLLTLCKKHGYSFDATAIRAAIESMWTELTAAKVINTDKTAEVIA